MSSLDLRALEQFARVVSAGSFARAALELGLTQPALSQSVRKLERKLRVRLVDRTPRGIVPTVFGEALLRRVRTILADVASLHEEIEAMRGGPGGGVAIGAAPAALVGLMPAVIDALSRPDNAIKVRIVEGLVDSLVGELRAGAIDFAITTYTQHHDLHDLRAEALFDDEFVACAATHHALARKREPSPTDLLEHPWVLVPRDGVLRREFDARFRAQEAAVPDATVETGSALLSRELVRGGRFLGFLPRDLIDAEIRRKEVAVLRVPWLRWIRRVSLLTRRNQIPSSACVHALSVVRRVAGDRS